MERLFNLGRISLWDETVKTKIRFNSGTHKEISIRIDLEKPSKKKMSILFVFRGPL